MSDLAVLTDALRDEAGVAVGDPVVLLHSGGRGRAREEWIHAQYFYDRLEANHNLLALTANQAIFCTSADIPLSHAGCLIARIGIEESVTKYGSFKCRRGGSMQGRRQYGWAQS